MRFLKKAASIVGILAFMAPGLALAQGNTTTLAAPAVKGIISNKSGTTFTLTSSDNNTAYAVNAASVTMVIKFSSTSITPALYADVANGDSLIVFGTVNGTAVTATAIFDGTVPNKIKVPKAVTDPNVVTRGTVTAVSGTTITIKDKTNAIFTVNAAGSTFIRNGGATMLISDIQVNDLVNVKGTVSGSTVTAKQVRDTSLQGNMNLSGTVATVNGAVFTITTAKHGTQTVNTTGTTTFTLNGAASTISAVTVGATVTVNGVWDTANNKIAAAAVKVPADPTPTPGKIHKDKDGKGYSGWGFFHIRFGHK